MEKTADPEAPIQTTSQADDATAMGENLKFNGEVHDIGAQLFQEVQQYSVEELESESAEVLRLIDWHIMPIVSLLK